MHFEPFIRPHFSLEHFIVHAIVKYFRAAAGHRAQTGLFQRFQHLADAHAGDPGEMDDFDGGEGLDVKRGRRRADAAKHVEVVVEFQPRMQPADDVHFGRAGDLRFDRDFDHLLEGHFIRALFAAFAVEGAELAGEGADVGVVDVAVAVVVGAVAMKFFAHGVGKAADAVDV